MIFNDHWRLRDKHAFLSPSSPAWIRYDEEKLEERWITAQAAKLGTEMHALAHKMIKLGVKAAPLGNTFDLYVNDCIGYKMTPEQTLYYSDNCFGTADAITFRRLPGEEAALVLRIFDLKTGTTRASVDQLLIYAALFCLEYQVKPFTIAYDLRIYKDNEIQRFEVDPTDILKIMDVIRAWDRRIDARMSELD